MKLETVADLVNIIEISKYVTYRLTNLHQVLENSEIQITDKQRAACEKYKEKFIKIDEGVQSLLIGCLEKTFTVPEKPKHEGWQDNVLEFKKPE